MNGQGPRASMVSRAWAFLAGVFVFVVLLRILAAMVMDMLPVLVAAAVVIAGVWWWRSTRSW